MLAHWQTLLYVVVYGECRDSERSKTASLSAWLIATQPPAGECRDSERSKTASLSAWLIAAQPPAGECRDRVLAHWQTLLYVVVYGECRDSERSKTASLSAWLIAAQPPVGECRDSSLSAYLIAAQKIQTQNSFTHSHAGGQHEKFRRSKTGY